MLHIRAVMFIYTNVINQKDKTLVKNLLIYSVIQKYGLSFVSLYFKIRTSDKYDVNCSWLEVECWNKDETHAAQQSPTQF
jgi:hypothetical protein